MNPGAPVSILLVDDNPANLLALESTLGDLGCEIVKARSGREALQVLLQRQFAAILLDVVMPEMDGFETAELIRTRDSSRHTPIIFLTAFRGGEEVVKTGYGAGAVDFLFKPYQPEFLRAKVRVLIDLYLLNQQLRRQAEELEAARALADQANSAKSEFLSRMSHELRTPMNVVLGFAQVLQLGDLTQDEADAVNHILQAGRHLMDLIDEVLDIARIETRRFSLTTEPAAIAPIVEEVLDLLQPLAAGRNIALRSRLEGSEAALADRQRLKQVLINVIGNAIKYNHEGGEVTVLAGIGAEGMSRIGVADNGPGISLEDVQRIFDPFERAGAERTRVQGTGLGLTISRQIVEAMNGRICVESAVGRGTTFWVDLPAGAAPVPGPVEAAAAVPATRGAPCVVLYIEDNLSNLALVEHVARRRPGTTLIPALQGRIGLELAHLHHPDLILLDLHLPDISGEQVLAALRSEPDTRDIPVVIASADAGPAAIDRLLGAGAHAYITKPIDVHQLLRVMDEAAQARIE